MPSDAAAPARIASPSAAGAALRAALHGDAALEAALLVVLVAPLFCFTTLPLYDLPNHIARQHILFGGGAPGADTYYHAVWRPLPNLALEGGVFLLHYIVPVDLAVRIFVALTLAQLFLGAVALNHTLFGHGRRLAFAAALFAYNGPFLFGFINDCFGIGMALWVVALWLRWRSRSAWQPLFAGLASLILFAHLFAFGVYALVICTTTASEAAHALRAGTNAPGQRILRALGEVAHLALPLGLYLLLMPRASHSLAGSYLPPLFKLLWLGASLGFHTPAADLPWLLILLSGALCLRRRLVLAPVMRAPLAALGLAYLALPQQLGEGDFVDYRMPAVIMLFLVGSLGWRNPADPRRMTAVLAVLGVLLLRLGGQFSEWAAWQPIYAQYRAAFALLPQGAKLLPVRPPPDIVDFSDEPPVWHFVATAVSERGALIPNLFANLGHQLLVYRRPYRALWKRADDPHPADAASYDYILVFHPRAFAPSALPAFQPIARGQGFVLGRLLH